jgi:RNA-binding protein
VKQLTGAQKKYLRGLAHNRKPVVFIGQNRLTENLIKALLEAIAHHELIKVKCIDFKEKEQKKALVAEIEKTADCSLVGMLGHILTFYKESSDPEKRNILLPGQ